MCVHALVMTLLTRTSQHQYIASDDLVRMSQQRHEGVYKYAMRRLTCLDLGDTDSLQAM
jgi:hypothetical protein